MPKKKLHGTVSEARYVEHGLVVLLAGQRVKGERPRHVIACNDFLRLGDMSNACHELQRLYRLQKTAFNKNEVDYPPPTVSEGTLRAWCAKYDWQGRLRLYLAKLEDEKKVRREVLADMYLAKPQDRIEELGFLYNVLKKPITKFHEQQIAFEKRDTEEGATLGEDGFYSFIASDGAIVKRRIMSMPLNEIKEARNVLDDIAREMGDRRGYVPKEQDRVLMVTGDDLRLAVDGMEIYQEMLTQAWDISNPSFIGSLDDLKVPDKLGE